MKKFLQLAIAHLYYTFMVAMFTSLGLIAFWWKVGETSNEALATMVVFAWFGLVASIGTFAIMMSMWIKKWPKTVDYYDIGIGIAGLGYGIWLVVKILWPIYMGYNLHLIFFSFPAMAAIFGVICALNYRMDSQRQPARK